MTGTIANRSVPAATVMPELAYADVVEATDWLCKAFGFTVRLRVGNHRAQLVYGEGAVIVMEGGSRDVAPQSVLGSRTPRRTTTRRWQRERAS